MVKARRIGHAVYETPDLIRQTEYYTDFLGLTVAGRERERVFLATKIGQLAIELNKGERERCTKLSFEIAPDSDFGDVARELSKDGIKSEMKNDSAPGIGAVVAFQDNKGTTVELFKEWSYLGKHTQVSGVGPLKLGHVAWVVNDVKATVDFYARVLGFRESDWIGDFFAFIRCNADHHTLNFIRGDDAKMHHMAFELKDMVHMQGACDLLGQRKHPILWGPLRHGPGHNMAIHHRNPDDQVIELYCELDQVLDEELGYFVPRPWHHDTPQRPKVWAAGLNNTWGLPPHPDLNRGRPRIEQPGTGLHKE
jgi:catechol 2,3-dioxygenase-like lactoylglutathione lyase family enzyme